MKSHLEDYSYPEKGTREVPDQVEQRILAQPALLQGASGEIPIPAKQFARRFETTVMHFPKQRNLPKWLLTMIEKQASAEELAKSLHDRLFRAPSKANQEMALLVANEI